MNRIILTLTAFALGIVAGASGIESLEQRPTPITHAVSNACADEWDRLDKLARLSASWIDTMSMQRATIDSLMARR